MYKLYTGPKAQNFKDSERPGSYRLASTISDNTFNAGDAIRIDQYITGYGACSGIKIICYISSHIFDEPNSKLNSGLRPPTPDTPLLRWGNEEIPISNGGYSFTLSSMKNELWPEKSSVFDTKEGYNYIITERNLSGAPISYTLKLHENVKPGNHYLSFYMTYFNGAEWICEEEKIQFRVNNTFEKYNTLISALAATALLVTIIHDGVFPLLESIHDLGVFMLKK